jgi:hypothetical protein
VLLKAAEMRKGLPITIVFEVERTSTSLDVLLLIKNFAKYFAVYASVIIVLSEANTGLVFGDDERHEITEGCGCYHEKDKLYSISRAFQTVSIGGQSAQDCLDAV